jgi:hypothetical protein
MMAACSGRSQPSRRDRWARGASPTRRPVSPSFFASETVSCRSSRRACRVSRRARCSRPGPAARRARVSRSPQPGSAAPTTGRSRAGPSAAVRRAWHRRARPDPPARLPGPSARRWRGVVRAQPQSRRSRTARIGSTGPTRATPLPFPRRKDGARRRCPRCGRGTAGLPRCSHCAGDNAARRPPDRCHPGSDGPLGGGAVGARSPGRLSPLPFQLA